MREHTHKLKVSFSVTNCICYDQRVLKMAAAVRSLDCDITIIGRRNDECCDEADMPFRAKRFNMLFRKGFLFYKFFNIRLFFFLLFHRFDILVANDLDTLLPNFLISRMKNKALIYDSHEYFTGVPELNGRPFVRWVWKSIEAAVFPHLKYVITVSNSIAELYLKEYNVMPVVVRNLSPSSENIFIKARADFGIPDGNLLLILQGGGINIDKGAEELIDAIAMNQNVSLIIAGSGDIADALKLKVTRLKISDRIIFQPLMPWTELMELTKMCDAGVSLEKDTNINYRFSLPNKLFDYISAGIPVITGNLQEIRKVVASFDCGLIIPEITPLEIGKAIIKLKQDRELLDKLKKNAVAASLSLNWENEQEKVIALYREVINEYRQI